MEMSERTPIAELTNEQTIGHVRFQCRLKNDSTIHDRIVSMDEADHWMYRLHLLPFCDWHAFSGLYQG